MISFIIPTKNEEKYLERLLESLKKYKKPHEIIVSDGASSDRTIEIARKYTDKIATIEFDNQTIAGGRDAGARMASGDLLAFFDADVIIPDINILMEKIEKYFEENPQIVAISGSLKVFPDLATWWDDFMSSFLNNYFYYINKIFGVVMVYGEFQITKKSAYEKVGGFNINLPASEDYDLFRRLNKQVGETRFLKHLLVFHTGRRVHKKGWFRVLSKWFLNWITVICTGHSFDKDWGGDVQNNVNKILYKGVIIKESLERENFLNELKTLNIEETDDENPSDKWHLYTVEIEKDKLQELSKIIKPTKYYADFKDENGNIVVVFRDKIFEFKPEDKETFEQVIQYGLSVDIPREQLDFFVG